MFEWIAENWATIVVSLGLAAILFFVIRSMIREKKRVKKCGGCMYCSSCSSSCGNDK